MTSKPLIKEALLILKFWGLDFKFQNGWTITKTIFIIILVVHLQIELALRLIMDWRGLASVEGVTPFIVLYQITCKIVLVIAKRNLFVKLLDKIEKFWPSERGDAQLQLEIKATYTTTMKWLKIFYVLCVATLAAYFLRPCFTTPRTLPFDAYHPTDRYKSPQYQLQYVIQLLTVTSSSSILISFDALFVSIIIHISCQLKIIKQGFLRLAVGSESNKDNKNCLKEVKKLVRYHNLVLGCVKEMRELFSILLLNQFLSSGVGISAGLVCIIADGYPPKLQEFLMYSMYVVTCFSELLFYCAAGSYLITVSESVSGAVFESNWWVKTQPQLRRAYVLVIQRANKAEKLTAGGMLTLDLESFTKIVRTSLSFFTVVQAMYSRT